MKSSVKSRVGSTSASTLGEGRRVRAKGEGQLVRFGIFSSEATLDRLCFGALLFFFALFMFLIFFSAN